MLSPSAAPARRVRDLLAAAAVLLLTACGGGDSTPTPPAVPGTLTVAMAPASLPLVAGTSGTSTATITRGGSFTGAVALTAEGAPTGVTITFASATLGVGVTSTVVTVATINSLAAGSYPVVIKASGTGVTVASATLTLTVTAAPPGPTPTLGLTLTPAATSIVAGTSGTAAAAIVRGGGFTGPVTLSAAGLPAGMTIAYSRATIPDTAATSTLTVTVGSGVAAGPYTVVVTAAGTGLTTTASIAVTVTAPVVGASINVAYCAADAPLWFAYQDGASGAWTRVLPAAGTNSYTFSMASTKGGVAVVDTVGPGYELSVIYATVAEFQSFDQTLQCGAKTINGSVAGVTTPQVANIALGYSTAAVIPNVSTAFALNGVPGGAQNLFAARVNGTTQRADRLILRRGVNLPDGGTLPLLDFNATEAFAPVSANVTLSGIGSDTASIVTLYNGVRGSSYGTIGTLYNYLAASGPKPFDAVPAAQLITDELQQMQAVALGANAVQTSRTSGVYFATPADVTLTMGPVISTPTVTRITGTSNSRVRVQLSLQTEYGRAFNADFAQASANRTASMFVTTGYTGGGAWDVSLPDVSAAAGWQNTWGLLNGTAIDWSVSVNGGAIFLLDRTVTSGTTFRSALFETATPLP